MPVLKPKWEKFAQELAKGITELEAYTNAGYSPHDSNASVLARKPEIIGRVSELIGEREQIHRQATAKAIERVALTKEWILEQLIENVARAMQAKQPTTADGMAHGEFKYEGGVANRSLELLGKELGMFVDRKETGKPGEFHKLEQMGLDELREFVRTGVVAAPSIREDDPAAPRGNGSAGGKPH